MLALCVSLCYLFWVSGGPRVLANYRMSARGSGVMRCDGMLMLLSLDLFITQPWVCDGMLYEMFVFDVLMFISLLVRS